MIDNNQEQNEFNDSLYQGDIKKKKFKIIAAVLAVLLVLGGVLFIFSRKKDEPINIKIENNQTDNAQINNTSAISQTISEEEIKKVQEQLAQFADDKDRDGLSAEKEKEFGTSDNDSDTDWDNVSDKDEIEKWGTNPTKADTDGDGYNDGFEINGGFNPKGIGKLLP